MSEQSWRSGQGGRYFLIFRIWPGPKNQNSKKRVVKAKRFQHFCKKKKKEEKEKEEAAQLFFFLVLVKDIIGCFLTRPLKNNNKENGEKKKGKQNRMIEDGHIFFFFRASSSVRSVSFWVKQGVELSSKIISVDFIFWWQQDIAAVQECGSKIETIKF